MYSSLRSQVGKTLQWERGRGLHPSERSAARPRGEINTALPRKCSNQLQVYCGELVQQLSSQVTFCESVSAIRMEWDPAEIENLYADF